MIRDPQLRKQCARFWANRRARYSAVILAITFVFSLGAELWCNNRPWILRYQGEWYFPLFKHYPSSLFGETVRTRVDFRALRRSPEFQATGGWMVMPLIPFSPNESMEALPSHPPSKPTSVNWLGTDDRGRDLLARLIYGYRNSMLFALASLAGIVAIAYTVGGLQAYLGGKVDFLGQRGVEIWHALPVLYVIVFLLSLFPARLWLLLLVWITFNWIPLSGYVRAEVLRVRKLEYITAARAMGFSLPRVLFCHVLPNTLTPVLTLAPFLLSASIGSLAALDYLGLGLPPPAASWGELLRQGKENLSSWWLAFFPFFSLFMTLLLLNFVGEGLREAFDARSHPAPHL